MRIGIDASRANLEQRTGTEWYAFHFIQAVFPYLRDDEVHLYVREPLRSEWGTIPSNVRVHVLHWLPGMLWTQCRLSWELLIHRVDVLFVPAHTVPFLAPKRTLTTLHDIGFEHTRELYGSERLGSKNFIGRVIDFCVRLVTFGHYGANEYDYHRFSARLAVSSCEKILTVSQYSKDDICTMYSVDPDKVIVIPNAYDREQFHSRVRDNVKSLRKAQQDVKVSPPYLITIGRIERKKNSLALVQAFERVISNPRHATLKLLMVGKPGFGYDEVMRYISTHNLSDRVVQTGWAAAENIPLLMAGAEAFIFPSLFEGFGIPVIEAMAVGTPVLCSNVTALPEVVGDAAELFDPANLEAMSRAILRVLEDTSYQEKLRERGFHRSREFSWDISARQLAGLLHKK